MYKQLTDIEPKYKELKNLALLPGFDINYQPKEIKEEIKIQNTFLKDNDVINENIFLKFFSFIDKSNNKSTRKLSNKSSTKKQTKKQR